EFVDQAWKNRASPSKDRLIRGQVIRALGGGLSAIGKTREQSRTVAVTDAPSVSGEDAILIGRLPVDASGESAGVVRQIRVAEEVVQSRAGNGRLREEIHDRGRHG